MTALVAPDPDGWVFISRKWPPTQVYIFAQRCFGRVARARIIERNAEGHCLFALKRLTSTEAKARTKMRTWMACYLRYAWSLRFHLAARPALKPT